MSRKRILFLISMVAMALSFLLSMCAHANVEYVSAETFLIKTQVEGEINKGDLIVSKRGIERVYFVDKQGSFYSEKIEGVPMAAQNCEHPLAKLQYKTRYNTKEMVKTASACYKRYEVTVYQCMGCMRNVTKTRYLETISKHTYKLLGKTCTECGYVK